MVWLAGPLIEIGGYRPLENYVVREMVVLIIGAMVMSAGSLRFYRRRKGAEQIAKGISGGTLPVRALIAAPHVAEPFFGGHPDAPVLRHGVS